MFLMYLIVLSFVSAASPSCVLLRTSSSECMLVTSLETNASCSPAIEQLSHCLEKDVATVTGDLPNSCNGDHRLLRGLRFYEITHYGPSIPTICNCNRSQDGALCDGSTRNEPSAASPKHGNVGIVVVATVIGVIVLILLAAGVVFLHKRKILKWSGSSNQPTVEEPVTAIKISKLYEEIDLSEPSTPSTLSTFKNPDDQYATVSKIRTLAHNVDKTATPSDDDDDDYSYASEPEDKGSAYNIDEITTPSSDDVTESKDKSPAHNIDETATPHEMHDTSDSEQLSDAENTDKGLALEKKNVLYNL